MSDAHGLRGVALRRHGQCRGPTHHLLRPGLGKGRPRIAPLYRRGKSLREALQGHREDGQACAVERCCYLRGRGRQDQEFHEGLGPEDYASTFHGSYEQHLRRHNSRSNGYAQIQLGWAPVNESDDPRWNAEALANPEKSQKTKG